MRCENCRHEVKAFTSVCPHCHANPQRRVDTFAIEKAERERQQRERDQERREIQRERREEELHRLNKDQARRSYREEQASHHGSGGDGGSGGMIKLVGGFLVLAAIVSFFQWVGGQISLRFGADYLALASVVLALWFLLGGFFAFKAVDTGKAGHWAPFGTWIVAFVLIMFLPDSIGLGQKPKTEPDQAQASESLGGEDIATTGEVSTTETPVVEQTAYQTDMNQYQLASYTTETGEESGDSASTSDTSTSSAAATTDHPGYGPCWRSGEDGWSQISEGASLASCAQQLFDGHCERPGGSSYGRWGNQTLRLSPGRVEVSSDNRNFSLAFEQSSNCSVKAE